MKSIPVENLSELPCAAAEIIKELDRHPVVAFFGAMGAGKTTLIREIAAQMGVVDNVTSPTFALVNQYETEDRQVMYHFDFYRINRLEEAYDLGYEEYFYSGNVCLVEWPEKIEELLPEDALIVMIEIVDENERLITIRTSDDL